MSLLKLLRKAPKHISDSQKPFSDKPEVEIWRNLIFKLAAIDFLFDRNTNYGSIRNRFHARNYFRFWRNRKYWHRTTAYVRKGFRAVHERLSDNYSQFWPKNTIYHKIGSGNTAKTPYFNSQPSTSYSTSIQCTGLSATVSMLETTSGHGETGSTKIRQRLTSITLLDRSTRHGKVLSVA